MGRFSSRDLFEQLNGRKFATYRKLEEGILTIFNEHLADFPPQYSYRQLIEWGARNNWIIQAEESGFHIEVS